MNQLSPTFVFPVTCEGSQYEEDTILASLLTGPGMYVDVGASHPQECSNTWRFYQRGWRGLLIDPLPETWYGLLRHRPEDHLFPVACSNTNGTATLRMYHSVSTLREDWPIPDDNELLDIETMRLSDILSLFPTIRDCARLLSVDVEGLERQVLEGNDWSTFRPEVVVCEYRMYDSESLGHDTSCEYSSILCDAGYHLLLQTDLNQIWTLPRQTQSTKGDNRDS